MFARWFQQSAMCRCRSFDPAYSIIRRTSPLPSERWKACVYGHPDLRGRIAHLRAQNRPPRPEPATPGAQSTLVTALSNQVNHLKKQHRQQVQALHAALERAHGENLDLRRELARRGPTGQPAAPADHATSIATP